MAKHDFRILIETIKGKQFSYMSQSFFNSDIDTNFAVSASDVFNRITHSTSCSFVNEYSFSGDFSNKRFRQDNFLSSSLQGNGETGSIKFIYKGKTDGDRLKRFKFFGSKVCDVLNLNENFWYRPSKFIVRSGSNSNYYRGDVDAENINVLNNFKVSSAGSVSSDLPFVIAKDNSRFIQFLNISGSNEVPNADLKIGYEQSTNTYMISASARDNDSTKFVIDGVTSLNVTHFTSSFVTSSVQQQFTEITSSGNSLFGDTVQDNHIFKGNVAIKGKSVNAVAVSHSVDGLTVSGSIAASEDVNVDGNLVVDGTGGSYFNKSPILAVKGIHIHSSSQNGNQQIVFSNDTSEGDKVPVIFRTAKANGGLLKLNVLKGLGYGIHHFVLSGSGGHSTQDIHVGIGGLPTPKMLSVFGSTTFGEDSDGSDEDIHIFSGSIDNVGSYIKTSGHITASGNISSSGTITAEQLTTTDDLNVGDNILFESEQAGLGRGADEWGQMYFSDELIQMGATGIGAGAFRVDGHSSAGALFITSSGKVGIGGGFDVSSPPSEALEVVGNISASGDLVVGNLSAKPYISASQGNIEMSGSGTGRLEVTGSIFVSNSGSFNYITASKIDVDDDTISIGGESINKTLVTNLKRRFSNTIAPPENNARGVKTAIVENAVSSSGATIYHIHTFADGDTTPSVKNGTLFKTANTSDTNIEGLDDGVAGQHVIIIIDDNNTDFVDGTNFNLFRGFDDNGRAQNDTMQFICVDGTKWIHLGLRGDNS